MFSEDNIYETAPKLTRMLLAPGESVYWTITYLPVTCDLVERIIVFEVDGWPKSAYSLHCSGRADIPSINFKPEIIFPSVSKNLVFLSFLIIYRV